MFYSREDLSGGLVGEPVDGIVGYDPATATAIMRNILLYASVDGNPAAQCCWSPTPQKSNRPLPNPLKPSPRSPGRPTRRCRSRDPPGRCSSLRSRAIPLLSWRISTADISDRVADAGLGLVVCLGEQVENAGVAAEAQLLARADQQRQAVPYFHDTLPRAAQDGRHIFQPDAQPGDGPELRRGVELDEDGASDAIASVTSPAASALPRSHISCSRWKATCGRKRGRG